MRKETMDGNTAAALASYYFTEVAAIYPITPSSPMAEAVDKWAATGRKNLFGQPVKLVEMQSEAGAAGTLHGSLQGGALTSTYTSSQGLLLMIPNLYKIAGELLPGVLHVSARSLASNALSIFGDHQDVMSVRQTGVVLLSSGSVQECMDLGCISHLAAVHSRMPFIHFFDGFRTSHEIQKIDVLEEEDIRELFDWDALEEFSTPALNPEHPVLRGTTQNPDIFFQIRESVNPFYEGLPDTVQLYMDKINEITGRNYRLFNYYGAPDADTVFIAMGSSCEVIKESIDYLNTRGEKLGLVQVHLFRPFSTDHFLQAVPASAKRIVVLDRTKEPGAAGEPLYLDVRNAWFGRKGAPVIIGGRYGLASKDFRPEDVMAVLDNVRRKEPKNGFTVGITDDVTGLSLPAAEKIPDTAPADCVNCKFWGFGSDGTVSANKSAVKIIGSHTDQYVQAYFAYDSKKSGGLTVSHLRFSKTPIRSSYLINHADYIACHNQAYVDSFHLLEGIREDGIFLLNCIWTDEELAEKLPEELIETILEKRVRFYTINGFALAEKLGLGKRINMIMQAAFFKLSGILPVQEAYGYLKEEVIKNYGSQGEKVINMNFAAIEQAENSIHKVDTSGLSREYKKVKKITDNKTRENTPAFVARILEPMNRQRGDNLPVSTFAGMEDGTFPTGTTCYEKRGIALYVPEWDPDKCLHCNLCSVSCPHSVLRPLLLTGKQAEEAPESIRLRLRPDKGYPGRYYYMGISPLDCTGCGNCIDVCPAKGKALRKVPLQESGDTLLWNYCESIETEKLPEGKESVKTSQFLRSYFEFSGACAGCGETPYARLITQLFGDRMMISNSAGCATVWGGSAPSVPYTKDKKGRGPAWGFSLFEDNAEYGLGMYLGYSTVRKELREKLMLLHEKLKAEGECSEELEKAWLDWEQGFYQGEKSREKTECLIKELEICKKGIFSAEIREILARKDYLVKRSNWIFGGDGWAYDIGYGGLDHVVSTGADINIMVFDTEVYSNTGGQASKSTPRAAIAKFAAAGKNNRKKELGMMIMNYENVYVAQIALGADPVQALKAIREAESYPGPSLIIGYAPCVNHGLKEGMGKSWHQQKKAVQAGYWNLYRYNPERIKEGANPFLLDSGKPSSGFREFLMSEVRFASLMKKDPVLAETLFTEAEEEAAKRYERMKKLSDLS